MSYVPPTSTPIAAAAVPPRLPGPRLRTAIATMVVALLAGALCVALAISRFSGSFTSPVRSTPAEFVVNAKRATYAVYERTGTQSRFGSTTFAEGHGTVLSPQQVTVTGPDGAAVPTRRQGAIDETVTRGGAVFTASVRFRVTSAGRYAVRVGGPPTEVIVARSLGDSFRAALGFILGAVAAGLLLVVGIVLLVVGAVRRSRAESRAASSPAMASMGPTVSRGPGPLPVPGSPGAPPTPPTPPTVTPAAWYPDPYDPRLFRYWDGQAWTGYTSPRLG